MSNDIKTLQAIEVIKNNPEVLRLMAEFKRVVFVGSYIMEKQAETEEELASAWLYDIKQGIYRKAH